MALDFFGSVLSTKTFPTFFLRVASMKGKVSKSITIFSVEWQEDGRALERFICARQLAGRLETDDLKLLKGRLYWTMFALTNCRFPGKTMLQCMREAAARCQPDEFKMVFDSLNSIP